MNTQTRGSGNGPRRPPAIAYVSIFLFGLLVAAAAKTFRDFVIESNHRELLRVTSPDGGVDAVFVRSIIGYFGNASALYLVAKGDAAPAWGPVVRAANMAEVPRLIWKNPQLLEMRFDRGCIKSFSNLWHSTDIEKGRYYVEVKLAPGAQYSCIGPTPGLAQRKGAVPGSGAVKLR